jgi:O-antigen/teichoic acid export membrane protein
MAETFLRLIGGAALLTLPAGVGLSLVAAPLVALAFGQGWEAAVPVLRILALSFTIMVFGHLSQHLLSAHALLGRLVGITFAGAIVRVILLALLIPSHGLAGAATAAAIAVLIEQALIVATAMQRFQVAAMALALHVWRPILASVSMAAILATIGLGWSDDRSVAALAEGAVSGTFVYSAVLLGCWVVAGRPPGAEADGLRLLSRLTERLSWPR